jgi:uncharacterized protein (DUF58 family)
VTAATSRSGGGPSGTRGSITPEIRARVRHIELRTRRLVESLFSGEYHSVFKGRGMEFSDVREYQPGDDVRAIDWNVTARRGRPYLKELVEERQLEVLLVVDLSASKAFGTGDHSNARVAAEIAAILGLAATRNNDRVGLLLVTDRVERFVPPDTGRNHALRLLVELLAHEPVGRGTRLTAALEYSAKVLRQRTVVFLVSDFLLDRERDAGLEHALRRLSAEHDVVPVRLSDPTAGRLPRVGMLAVVDPESGSRRLVNTDDPKVREAHRRRFEDAHAHVGDVLRRTGLDTVEVVTTEDYVPPLVALFRRRSRGGG